MPGISGKVFDLQAEHCGSSGRRQEGRHSREGSETGKETVTSGEKLQTGLEQALLRSDPPQQIDEKQTEPGVERSQGGNA